MSGFTETQQAFVRHHMDENVIGVRVQRIDDEMVLVVDVYDPAKSTFPETFGGLDVRVREGRRAVLAYC